MKIAIPTKDNQVDSHFGHCEFFSIAELTADNQIWFFTLYDKSEAIDLTPDEKKQLKQAIQREVSARRKL